MERRERRGDCVLVRFGQAGERWAEEDGERERAQEGETTERET